jgi:hypothetical protein
MAEGNGDWLRARGIGRERFAGYLTDYLGELGYRVERTDTTEPSETLVRCELARMIPSVPPAAHALQFRLYPTSGGAAVVWQAPTEVPADQKSRMDRLVREMETHLERAVHTESHATAKVVKPPTPHLPWSSPAPAPTDARRAPL